MLQLHLGLGDKMKYVNYDPSPERGGCIIRSFSKAFNKDYYEVKDELELLGKKNNCSWNDDKVIEEYFSDKNISNISYNGKVTDYDYDGKYLVYCHSKDKDNYHMVCIINNTIYDRDERVYDMYVVELYKVGE